MRNAEVESSAQHGAGIFEIVHTPEVMPQPERDGGKLNAAASRAAVLHGVVAFGVGYVQGRISWAKGHISRQDYSSQRLLLIDRHDTPHPVAILSECA